MTQIQIMYLEVKVKTKKIAESSRFGDLSSAEIQRNAINTVANGPCKWGRIRSPSPGASISHTNPMRQPLRVSFYL